MKRLKNTKPKAKPNGWENLLRETVRLISRADGPFERKSVYYLQSSKISQAILSAEERAREEVIKAINLQLDLAENDKEMADDPSDPKIRINYFRHILQSLSLPDQEQLSNSKTE